MRLNEACVRGSASIDLQSRSRVAWASKGLSQCRAKVRKAALREKENVKDAVFTSVLEGLGKGEKEEATARHCVWGKPPRGEPQRKQPSPHGPDCTVLSLSCLEASIWRACSLHPVGDIFLRSLWLSTREPCRLGRWWPHWISATLSPMVGARPVFKCVINMDKEQELFMELNGAHWHHRLLWYTL